MPYIKSYERDSLDLLLEPLIGGHDHEVQDARTSGELNYIITTILLHHMRRLSYEEINRMIGILECCKLEFYRRKVSHYEDTKLVENGDVY